MRKISCSDPAGRLWIFEPAINVDDPEDFTEADAEARMWGKLPADYVNPRFVTDAEIPTDRTFRDAWDDAGSISVNMGKAREIHRERMRRVRAPLLAALDIRQLRGEDVDAEKQVLRDVTADPAIDSANTPDELKAVWPAVLR